MCKKISQPHDALFKDSLTYSVIREEVIKTCLPEKILSKLDLSTITSINKSYIDQELYKYESDILFSVKNKFQKNNFIYILVEHQRKAEKFLPVRVFNYKAKIITDYLKQYPLTDYVPAVYSIVYYNGDKPYHYSLDLFDLFSEPEIMKDSINLPLNLYDLNNISDNTIRKRTFMSLMDHCMKHVPRRNFVEKTEEFCQIVYKAQQTNTEISDLLMLMFKYIISVTPRSDHGEIMAALRDNLPEGRDKERFMSIWENGKFAGFSEGKLEGKLEGKRETKQEMAITAYKHGISPDIIGKITGYSLGDLNKILES